MILAVMLTIPWATRKPRASGDDPLAEPRGSKSHE